MSTFKDFKRTRDAFVSGLGKVLYEHSPKKLSRPNADQLARRVAKKIAIKATHGQASEKQVIARFKFEMHDTIKAASSGDFDISVASVLNIRKKQIEQRNAANLSKHLKAATSQYSPAELAQLAMKQENTNGKGGMTQGHTAASNN